MFAFFDLPVFSGWLFRVCLLGVLPRYVGKISVRSLSVNGFFQIIFGGCFAQVKTSCRPRARE
jgi:hypothetical protein